MIADLDETLRQLLIAEMPVKNGEVDIKFDQPRREWSSRLSKPTVNLFLYDVRENNVLRQHQWEQMSNNGRVDNLAHLKRTPFRVDCFYMLTTWANDPGDEHRLLTRALLALFRFGTLPEDRLVGSLRNSLFELQARLACHDRLTNPAEVWSALDNEMRPSVPYIVTLALDPWTEVTGPVVSTLTLHSGQAPNPLHEKHVLDGTSSIQHWIGGTVYRREDKSAIKKTRVAVAGTDIWVTTDDKGRYTIGPLMAGSWSLVVGPPEKPLEQKTVFVPRVEHLFRADLSAVAELDAGKISTALRQTFQDNARKLSSKAHVMVRQIKTSWTILDVGQTYFLGVDSQMVNVYAVREETYDLNI